MYKVTKPIQQNKKSQIPCQTNTSDLGSIEG